MIGFLIAPAIPGVVLEAARLVPGLRDAAGFGLAMYSYPVAWLFGVPAFLLYERLGWRQAGQYAAGGFLFMQAFVWSFVGAFPTETLEPDFTYVGLAYYGAGMGMLALTATVAFWAIAVCPHRGARAGSLR